MASITHIILSFFGGRGGSSLYLFHIYGYNNIFYDYDHHLAPLFHTRAIFHKGESDNDNDVVGPNMNVL